MQESVERKVWDPRSHESKVEHFYSHGTENYADFHKGYLNFGLWENGIMDYGQAAENLVRRMAETLELTPKNASKSRLLDVACGMGSQDVFLQRSIGPLQIDAIDVTWAHIHHGRRRVKQRGLESKVRFHHGSATAIPFDANSFTHVMSIEGPIHFNTRQKFLSEAFRVLKPGGVMALADYVVARKPKTRTEWVLAEAARVLWKMPRANLWTSEDYRKALKAQGFKEMRVQEVGALTFPGYFLEQSDFQTRSELARIRGFVAGRLGFLIDIAAYAAYQLGLVDYVLVKAKKPRLESRGAPR